MRWACMLAGWQCSGKEARRHPRSPMQQPPGGSRLTGHLAAARRASVPRPAPAAGGGLAPATTAGCRCAAAGRQGSSAAVSTLHPHTVMPSGLPQAPAWPRTTHTHHHHLHSHRHTTTTTTTRLACPAASGSVKMTLKYSPPSSSPLLVSTSTSRYSPSATCPVGERRAAAAGWGSSRQGHAGQPLCACKEPALYAGASIPPWPAPLVRQHCSRSPL